MESADKYTGQCQSRIVRYNELQQDFMDPRLEVAHLLAHPDQPPAPVPDGIRQSK